MPLVSRILPSDICRIHKRGSSIRLDTTLVDFNDMRWERGDISFLFNGDRKPNLSLTVLDNKAELYQRVRYEVVHHNLTMIIDQNYSMTTSVTHSSYVNLTTQGRILSARETCHLV